MVVDAKTRAEIEKQGKLYEATRERIVSRIQSNIRIAKEKLDITERELIKEVEIEFGENPFAQLITSIDSENPPTDEEVRDVLNEEIPQDFGPSEEAFFSLCREIEAFKSWRAKKAKNPSVPAPSNFRVESTTQDAIKLAWNDDWMASSYQIEMDGGKSLDRVSSNTFIKTGLLPDTEHTFRMRAMCGDSVSEWSDVVKKRTEWSSVWKECPDDVNEDRKYSVDEKNPRIATNIGCSYCTIIGNVPLPLNK